MVRHLVLAAANRKLKLKLRKILRTIFDVLEIIKVLNFRMSRQRAGDVKMEGELLALTYGAVVARVLKDYEKTEEVNTQVRRSC